MSALRSLLPNLVSVIRAILAVPICVLLANGSAQTTWLAFALFVVAVATDFLDGALARRLQAQSTLGSHLDPLADKVLVGLPLAVLPITQNYAPAALTVVALFLFCGAEIPMAWARIKLIRRGCALHASRSAKWKTFTEYAGVAVMIVGLAPVPSQELLQFAGSAIVALACGYAWRSRFKGKRPGLR